MTPEQIIEMAKQAEISVPKYFNAVSCVRITELQAFAQLVRNAALDEAQEVCHQVVHQTSTTLTWEGCSEILQALDWEKV